MRASDLMPLMAATVAMVEMPVWRVMVPWVLLASTALIGIAMAVLEALVEAAARAAMEALAERAAPGRVAVGRTVFGGWPLMARSVLSAVRAALVLMPALWPTAVPAATRALAGSEGPAAMRASDLMPLMAAMVAMVEMPVWLVMVPRVLLASTALIGIAMAVLEALVEAAARAVMEALAERAAPGRVAVGRTVFGGWPLTARSVVSAVRAAMVLMPAV